VAAFIHIGWIFFLGTPLTGAVILSLVVAWAIWKWV